MNGAPYNFLTAREESDAWLVALFDGTNPERGRFNEIIQRHHEEIAVAKGLLQLNVNWEGLSRLTKNGHLVMCTARDDSVMVGYFLCGVYPMLHYMHINNAIEDAHFILPEHRRKGLGADLVRCVERAVIKRNANLLKVRDKVHSDNGEFWAGLGYERIENVYMKLLPVENPNG